MKVSSIKVIVSVLKYRNRTKKCTQDLYLIKMEFVRLHKDVLNYCRQKINNFFNNNTLSILFKVLKQIRNDKV